MHALHYRSGLLFVFLLVLGTFLSVVNALALTPIPMGPVVVVEPTNTFKLAQASPAAKMESLSTKPGDFPSGALQFWVGYAPGGAADIGARILATGMEKIIGQPVTVVNKDGAQGQVMWTELARQTRSVGIIGLMNAPLFQTIVADPERKASFTVQSFSAIANQVLDPGTLFVAKNSKYQSLEQLLEAAKQNPGQVKIADPGISTDDHLMILDLERKAGVKFRIVHFQGGAATVAAILGNQVDAASDNVGLWVKYVKSGDGRLLAVADKVRSPYLPDVPTFQEKGVNLYSYTSRGVIGPPGMKPDHIRYISAVVEAALKTPQVKQRMDEVGLPQRYMGPDEYGKFLQDQQSFARELFRLIEEERKK
ncbi:MAG: tripartite tricarboxylate transporter substrate binding protein [Casimicrobiaceae bacterium]